MVRPKMFLTYLLGLTAVGLLTYFQQALTLRLNGPRLATMSPSGMGVLLAMLGGALLMVKLVGQRLAVARQRLVLLYIMLAIGLPLGAMGGATALTGAIGRYVFTAGDPLGQERYPYYQAMPLDLWPGLYGSPEVEEFHHGGARAVPWASWQRPLLLWNIFFVGMTLCMVGLGMLLKRRWIDREALPCPLNELPGHFLNINQRGEAGLSSVWMRSRAFWIGFAIVLLIFLNNGLAHYAPHLFSPLEMRADFGRLFNEEPLSAMKRATGGPVPNGGLGQPGLNLTVIPALVAIAFFLPKEISFSTLVFYFAGRLLTAVGSALEIKLGIPRGGNSEFVGGLQADTFPFLYSFGVGAFLFIAFGRTLQFLVAAIRDRELSVRHLFPSLFLLIGGAAAVVWWLCWFGLPIMVSLIMVGGTIFLAVAFTRLRVEGGIPLLFGMPPFVAMLIVLGLTPFTRSYDVTPGAEDQPVPEISMEARADFEKWHQANMAEGSDGVTEPTAPWSERPITARDFCTFLNTGLNEKHWSKDDHQDLVFRRPEAHLYVAGICTFILFAYVAVLAVPALLLEGFQLANRVRLSGQHVVVGALLAVVVALAVGQRASLPHFYDVGALNMLSVPDHVQGVGSNKDQVFRTWGWSFVYDGLNTANAPTWGFQKDPDWLRILVASLGFVVTGILGGVRTIYCNFPLVPLGIVVAYLYGAWCWGSILIGYVAKTTVLRFGGFSLYAKSKPFFVGLFCGQVVAMVLWAVVALTSGEFGNGFNLDASLGLRSVF